MSRKQGDSLVPIVYRDFTGGLYELGHERGIPSNALLECKDFMPLPSGGLRAAWAWREENLGSVPRNRRVMGFQTMRGIAQNYHNIRTGLMLASTASSFAGAEWTYEYWFARGGSSELLPEASSAIDAYTPWTSGPSHSSVRNLWPVRFMPAYNSSAEEAWYYNIFSGGSVDAPTRTGLFRLTTAAFGSLASSVSVQVATVQASYMAVHQSRIVMAVKGGSTNAGIQTLVFTNPSTDAAPPTSNNLGIAQYHLGQISYMESFFPNDLMVLKVGHGGFMIQGDIGSGPLVRDLVTAHIPERLVWGTRTPDGVVFMTEHDGVWLWSGSNQTRLSPQFVGTPMTEAVFDPYLTESVHRPWFHLGFLGMVGRGGRWLFFPKGYVYDQELNCWFRTTLPGDDLVYPFWSYDEIAHRIYAAGYREPGDDVTIISSGLSEHPSPKEISNMRRAGTASVTLPLVDLIERGVQIRQIEVFGQGFGNGGTWRLEISNDEGKTKTEERPVPARAASMRVNTSLGGDWLKIRIVSEGAGDASSPTGKSEAPMIDRLVLWARPHHRRAAA